MASHRRAGEVRPVPVGLVKVNLAYRWFRGLSIERKISDHSAFSRARNERFRESDIFGACLSVVEVRIA
jgi:transposase